MGPKEGCKVVKHVESHLLNASKFATSGVDEHENEVVVITISTPTSDPAQQLDADTCM